MFPYRQINNCYTSHNKLRIKSCDYNVHFPIDIEGSCEVLAEPLCKKMKLKGYTLKTRKSKFPLADNIVLYMGNPKDCTKR